MTAKKGRTMQRLLHIVKRFPSLRILVIGDVMLDKFIWGSVERISPEAPVQVVNVSREEYSPGGAANVASNLCSLGAKARVVGTVGKDGHNRQLLSILRKQGAITDGIIYDRKKPTTQKIRIISQGQQLLRVDYERREYINAQDEQKIQRYVAKAISDVHAVIISDYAKGLITRSLMGFVIRLARRHKKRIIVDPKPKHSQYYRLVDLITPNHREACEMAGIEQKNHELAAVGKELSRQMRANVLVTRGEKGMTLFELGKQPMDIPTRAVNVYDVTGAGDTVIATLGLCLGAGASLVDAAVIANHAAGIIVGKVGTATLSLRELSEAIAKDESLE